MDFRQNRQPRRRTGDLTRRFRSDQDALIDHACVESVRAKGELSRKRTIIADEQDAPLVDESLWRPGTVTAVHGLVCRVDADGRLWDCLVRRKLRTLLIQQRAAVVCGDRVWFSDQSAHHDGQAVGVIERVDPRRTTLSRRDFRGREHVIVANVEQLLIVSSVARPRPKPHLLDRYLVAAGKGNLRPVIVFNKCDLQPAADAESGPDERVPRSGRPRSLAPPEDLAADEAAQPQAADAQALTSDEFELDLEAEEACRSPRMTLDELIEEYRALGFTVLRTSAATGQGLDALRGELAGRSTVLSGQSGVGKSSLLNALMPGLNLPVREVSEETEKGRHTTTHAQLIPLSFGAYVVDTPGIRQFDLWNVEPGELEAFFVEFVPLVPQCRFKDCHHVEEAGCAVRAAVEQGAISARRYASYLKMLTEMALARRERLSS